MSRSQIHVLDKVVQIEHRKLKRELKILEVKQNLYNNIQQVITDTISTVYDIVNRFVYDEPKMVNLKQK